MYVTRVNTKNVGTNAPVRHLLDQVIAALRMTAVADSRDAVPGDLRMTGRQLREWDRNRKYDRAADEGTCEMFNILPATNLTVSLCAQMDPTTPNSKQKHRQKLNTDPEGEYLCC
jgi:hypothetical protein